MLNLNHLGAIRGHLPATVGLPADYFLGRGCFVDAKGPLTIAAGTYWGYGVRVLTRSHAIGEGGVGAVIPRPVVVARGAWIGSFALLYNCQIGEGAIVAAGAVVRSCEVAPRVMVAGNPAEVVARWDGSAWQYLAERRRVLR